MILAAIEKSDGTRKGVNDAVFSGAGVVVPADKSLLGTEIAIDPATGDIKTASVTIYVVQGGAEVDLMPWEVK